MNRTDWWANLIADFEFRSAALAKPTEHHYALFTVAPTAAGGGTEVVGGSYARVALPPLDSNYYSTQGTLSGASSGTSRIISTGPTLTWPAPTADWGLIVGAAIFDAATGGNMRYWFDFALATPVYDSFTVLSGQGAVTIDPASFQLRF